MELNKESKFIISGGQVNIANGNGVVNATQNNERTVSELDIIIKGINDNISGLSKENAEAITDSVEIIQEELVKAEPRVSRLRNCITLIAPMITVANGIPTLASNLQKLIDFVKQYIH